MINSFLYYHKPAYFWFRDVIVVHKFSVVRLFCLVFIISARFYLVLLLSIKNIMYYIYTHTLFVPIGLSIIKEKIIYVNK